MARNRTDRRLAAILSADVAGFSRLMAEDERGTLDRLKTLHREVFAPAVLASGGRIVKLMGDGALVEFPSVTDAVACALAIQARFAERNASEPGVHPVELRIGINLGDVIVTGRDIYGHGVNVAARLQTLAEPGGIALSAAAHEHVAGRLPVVFADCGEQALRNIPTPVRVMRWPAATPLAAHGGAAAPTLPDRPSIAVLPFDDLSADGRHDPLADGVVEAITATLSRIRSFFVIARNSSFAYKGRAVNVREIGRELGVAYVLEGSVQCAGGRVRITVQLIETAGGGHLWAEKYDGTLDEIFDLQDRITEKVAGALQPSIRQAEVERARRKRPQELGAYDYTMRAMSQVWLLEKDATARGLELLDAALALDPDYPLALALAAWCWAQRSVYNWVEDIDDARARALALADRAAELSGDDPLILTVLGAVHTFARHYGAARVLLERAATLDPNSAWTFSRLGWLETYGDRPAAARAHFERALRLSPLDPMNFNNYVGLASAAQVEGDDEGAAELFLRALEERPNALWIHRNLAPALLGAGREDEARASRRALMAAYPEMSVARFRNAMVFSPRVLARIGEQLRALGVPEG